MTMHANDVALIEDGFEDVRRMTRVNGQPAQGLGIRKQRGANAVAVAQAVREELTKIQKAAPDGMDVGLRLDRPESTAARVPS